MTVKEREILKELVREVQESDDKIDPLETLYFTVKKMLKL